MTMAGSAPPGSVENRVRRSYSSYKPEFFPTEKTMYINLGYWRPGCSGLDEACQTLADVLADAAGIREGDRVLDAGFGYADQDMRWLETRRPRQIAGLNITPGQVEVARQRARERGLDDRLDLRVGSATAMPFDAGAFDRVVALESAFHFDTRQDFFREAHRVLRPGGVLATADVVLLGASRQRLSEMEASEGLMPTANWCDRETYAQRLRDAGFGNVSVRPISAHVYPPLVEYLTAHVDELRKGQPALEKLVLTEKFLRDMQRAIPNNEYVIAVGEKPG
jgi:erythromycin 3''-O-methyltransferase